MLNTLLQRFAARPDDTPELRLEKATIFVVAGSCSLAGVVWTLMYLAVFGPGVTALLPALFVVIVGGALWISHRRGDHLPAVYAQIVCIMYVTALLQWSIGDIGASGYVLAWAFCGPITALVFFPVRRALVWLGLYVVNIVVTVVFNDQLSAHGHAVSAAVRSMFYIMNLSVSSLVVFIFAAYFVEGRRLAEARVREKHAEVVASHQALVQREKLAALGQLVAGVAHELNTPLGAIGASVDNITTALDQTLVELPGTLASLSPDDLAGLTALLRECASTRPSLTSREERARRGVLQSALEAREIPDARSVARILVSMGVGDDLDAHVALLRSPRAEALLRATSDLVSLRRNSGTIRTAADRAAKIVFALKSYAHPGAAGSEPVEARLDENVETVLTLYQNLLKSGVDVVRRFEDPGLVRGRHEELNQVWTNLVHNALQAMSYKGVLELRVAREAGRVIVEVTDSGAGIPDAVRARIFEPFYTTKAQGEGSGLGLSICKEIVERHDGSLAVESRPGRTVFTVSLPSAAAS